MSTKPLLQVDKPEKLYIVNMSDKEKPIRSYSVETMYTNNVVIPEGFTKDKKFPYCCIHHTKICNHVMNWFNRKIKVSPEYKEAYKGIPYQLSVYDYLPEKIIRNTLYTNFVIKENINSDNWKEEIKDYIDHIVLNLSNLPISIPIYKEYVTYFFALLNGNAIKNFTEKREWLFQFLLEGSSTKKEKKIDIEELYNIFKKWLQLFPDLKQFATLRKELEEKFPIDILASIKHYNKYSGQTEFEPRSEKELVKFLFKLTKKLLATFDSYNMEDTETRGIKLTKQSHKIKQDLLLNQYNKKEIKYAKLIQTWLKNEKEYLEAIEKQKAPNLSLDASVLPENIYDIILDDIYTLGIYAEGSFPAASKFGEEEHRNFFLPLLNAKSKLYNATGETFNKKGKTDILIKNNDGVNIFIAECKLWNGEKKLMDGITQLLERYVTWRDEKVALIIFNKSVRKFSNLLYRAKKEISNHPYFKKYTGSREKTSFSYNFIHPDDNNKTIKLELIIFNYYQ